MAQANKTNKLPSYIKKEDADENQFNAGDVEFPQLKLAQGQTDEAIKQKDAHIKGLEPGMYFNSITREVYGEEVEIVPISFFREIVTFNEKDGPIEFFNYVVSVNGDKKDLAVMSLKSTAIKIAKRLNAYIKIKELPSYAGNYKLTANFTEGDKGDWFAPVINQSGWASEEQYVAFKLVYEAFKNAPPKIGYDSNTGNSESTDSDDIGY